MKNKNAFRTVLINPERYVLEEPSVRFLRLKVSKDSNKRPEEKVKSSMVSRRYLYDYFVKNIIFIHDFRIWPSIDLLKITKMNL